MIYRSRHTTNILLHHFAVSVGIVLMFVLALVAFPVSLEAQGEQVSTMEEGFIQVEVMGVKTWDMDVMIDSGVLYVPFIQFFDLLDCKLTISNDRQELRADLAEGHWFTISQITRQAVHDDVTFDFDPSMVYATSGEVYVKLALIEQCLGLQMDYSFKELRLSIPDYSILPVANMAHTRRGWQVLMGGEKTTEVETETSLNRQFLGAMAFDWNYEGTYFHSGPLSEQENSGSVRLAMPFLYGILNIGGSGEYKTAVKRPIDLRLNGWTWDFYVPDFSLLSKVTISSPLKGQYSVAVTNTPLTPVRNLGTHDLIGYTQPKWLVEMYDGERLVAEVVADSNGRYRFSIPVGYGSIRRRTVAIGPHSEKVVEEHDIEFNQRILTPGTIDYLANVAIDTVAPTTPFTANLNLQTGLFNWLGLGVNATLRLATMKSLTSSGSRWYDTIAPTYVANLWLGGRTEANLKYDHQNAELSGTFTALFNREMPISLGVTGLRPTQRDFASRMGVNASTNFLLDRASLSLGGLYLNNEITVMPTVAGMIAGLSGSVQTEILFPMGDNRSAASDGDADSAVPRNTDPRRPGFTNTRAMLSFSLLDEIFFSTEADYSHARNTFRRLAFRANYALSSDLRMDLSYSVADYDWKRGSVVLGLNLSTDIMQITAGGTKRGESAYMGFVGLAGAMMFSSAGIQTHQSSLRGQSMILLNAFRDRNGNGEQDDGEEDIGAPEGVLTTEMASLPSTNGEFTGIPTTQDGLIIIDQYIFADQNLFPSKRYFGIYPMPNSVATINVPFCEGYDLTGSCQIEHSTGDKKTRSTKGVNGLRITLESTTGVGMFEGEIYSDGSVLISGVPAGEYRIRLDSNQLEYRRLTLDQSHQEIVTVTDTHRELPLILLLPKALDGVSPLLPMSH